MKPSFKESTALLNILATPGRGFLLMIGFAEYRQTGEVQPEGLSCHGMLLRGAPMILTSSIEVTFLLK